MWKVSLHLTKDLPCKKVLFLITKNKNLAMAYGNDVSYHLGFYILKKLSVFFVGEILHPGDQKKNKKPV
jgi:hypothetical protein